MSKTKILTISSNPAMLRFLNKELGSGDYEIAGTEYNQDGLRNLLDEELPDLLIIDIVMPSLDGIRICLDIRQWSQVPIMMLSTWGTEEGNVRGLDLGSDSYLTKPFGIDELKLRIKEILWRNHAVTTGQPADFRSGL